MKTDHVCQRLRTLQHEFYIRKESSICSARMLKPLGQEWHISQSAPSAIRWNGTKHNIIHYGYNIILSLLMLQIHHCAWLSNYSINTCWTNDLGVIITLSAPQGPGFWFFCQRASTRMISAPRGHLPVSSHSFGCQNWSAVLLATVLKGQRCCWIPHNAQKSPSQQGIIWPQVSIILLLKNPNLSVSFNTCKECWLYNRSVVE